MPRKKPFRRPSLKDEERALQRATKKLRALKNVVYVTLGYKQVHGTRSDIHAAIVYVRKKGSVRKNDLVPSHIPIRDRSGQKIADLPTDVVEVKGKPRLFGIRSGDRVRGGTELGTCALTFTRAGRKYLLTNAHVACDPSNGGLPRKIAVKSFDGGGFISIGPVQFATPITQGTYIDSDFAIIAIPNEIKIDAFRIRSINVPVANIGWMEKLDMREHWFCMEGKILKCTHAQKIEHPVSISFQGLDFDYTNVWQLKMTEGEAGPGQSGALLCRTEQDGVTGCGLVFGGFNSQLLWVFCMDDIWKRVAKTLGEDP